MFKGEITTLDLNKQGEKSRDKELFFEAQRERASWLTKLLESKTTDFLLNWAPGLGETKALHEAWIGQTLSGKELTPFEQAVWAMIPVLGLAFAVNLIQGESNQGWQDKGVEFLVAKLQSALLLMSAKDMVSEICRVLDKLISPSSQLFNYVSEKIVNMLNSFNTEDVRNNILAAIEATKNRPRNG